MADSLFTTMSVSANGMRAQGERTRVIAENMANAQTTGTEPGADPYSRKTVTFKNELDRTTGANMVSVDRIKTEDNPEFDLVFEPDHPAANADGYVKMPNVSVLMEMNDMREAQRSYEANLSMLENSRSMVNRTIDLLR